MNIYSVALTLFFVMDPLGNVPIFLSVLAQVESRRRYPIILRESLIAFFILVLFLFFGDNILHGLGITQSALTIGGGIVLFLIAIKMIFPPETVTMQRERQLQEPFIVPLAIPLLAGPSAIVTVMLLGTQPDFPQWKVLIALVFASLLSTLLLLVAPHLRRVLGQKGLTAIERLMGMALITIAVQMFLVGIGKYFHLQVSN